MNNIKFLQIVWLILLFGSFVIGVLHPVVLIPGDGGNQLEARLNKTNVVHYICEKVTNDFFNIWLNMELLLPIVIDCWIDNIKLIYDNKTRTTHNAGGVDIRVPGFGDSETVEWIDPSHALTGSYFSDIANNLVSMGYRRNISIRGAPYDFRRAPNENQDYFIRLKKLIEDTYESNNKTSVMLIVHSMGGPMSLYFLNRQSQSWKDKYVKRLVSLSAAWGGSMKALKVYAIGDNLGSYVLRESIMREEQISQPSTAWLLPSPLFWKPDEVLIQTEKKNYSLANLRDFFEGISFPEGYEMWKDTVTFQKDFQPPGVEVHCLYGTEVETVERLYYKPGTWLDGYPTLISGDGDGTVNLRSLQACQYWQAVQKKKVFIEPLPKTDHLAILHSKSTLTYLSGLVKSDEAGVKEYSKEITGKSSWFKKLLQFKKEYNNRSGKSRPGNVLYINNV